MRFAPFVAASLLCAFSPAFAAQTDPYYDSLTDDEFVHIEGVGGEVTSAWIDIAFSLSGIINPGSGGDFGDRHANRAPAQMDAEAGMVHVYLNGTFDASDFGWTFDGDAFDDDVMVDGVSSYSIDSPGGSMSFAFTPGQFHMLETGFDFTPIFFDPAFGVTGDSPSYQRGDITANATYVIRYTLAESAVPEPATWAMMIAGFGLTGGAMRRRRAIPSLAL